MSCTESTGRRDLAPSFTRLMHQSRKCLLADSSKAYIAVQTTEPCDISRHMTSATAKLHRAQPPRALHCTDE